MADDKSIAHWRIILAAVLDFFTAFFVIGFIVATFSGETIEGGFALEGGSALLLFILVVAYFWIGRKYLGGTIWQRILKAR